MTKDLEDALEKYILNNCLESLNRLLERDFYNLILKLFKRNGIFYDRFPYSEFPSLFYSVSFENMEELKAMFNIKPRIDIFLIVSKISNYMLKSLNRDLYKRERDRKKEFISEKYLSSISTKIEDLPEKVTVSKFFMNKPYITRISLGMYYGFDRPYKLSVDEICSIVNVKRSSLFLLIKKFKQEIRKEIEKIGTN